MKLTIDLDNVGAYDDETVAAIIANTVGDEIRRFAVRLAKEALKKHEADARKAVAKAVDRDWRKVAKLLETLESS